MVRQRGHRSGRACDWCGGSGILRALAAFAGPHLSQNGARDKGPGWLDFTSLELLCALFLGGNSIAEEFSPQRAVLTPIIFRCLGARLGMRFRDVFSQCAQRCANDFVCRRYLNVAHPLFCDAVAMFIMLRLWLSLGIAS